MKIDSLLTGPITEAGRTAAGLETAGYSGAWSLEGPHDPFLPLAVAAASTHQIELGTAIAVAFARNPMLLANIGWDLQTLSRGRFVLGLGSQIKPHITKRFSMEWSRPAAACARWSRPCGPSGTAGRTAHRCASGASSTATP